MDFLVTKKRKCINITEYMFIRTYNWFNWLASALSNESANDLEVSYVNVNPYGINAFTSSSILDFTGGGWRLYA